MGFFVGDVHVEEAIKHLTAVTGRALNQLNLVQMQVARLERILEEIHEVKFGTHVTTGRLGDWPTDPKIYGNAVNQ